MVILASKSPRRVEILEKHGFEVMVVPSNFDESSVLFVNPSDFVLMNSRGKAHNIALRYPQDIVIAADTIVYHHDKKYGKPRSMIEARTMLESLSGETHEVYTGVTIIYNKEELSFFEVSQVTFKILTDNMIEEHLRTEEPFDKAGGYGIQGFAKTFIQNYSGELETIIGLPVKKLVFEIKRLKKYQIKGE